MSLIRLSIHVVMAVSLVGCVQETRRVGGRPAGQGGGNVAMPIGPIARPLDDVTTSARVRVVVTPIGLVRYDGLVLPLLSPDGRYLVVEDGESPTWPTLLASLGARPPLRTRLQVYEFTDKGMVRVRLSTPLASGLVLGRSANETGFLVESPQADGSRWIGEVAWQSGEIRWLVKDDAVNAHAVYTPKGHLVYTSRPVGGSASALVLRDRLGFISRAGGEGVSYAFPTCTDEPGVVYVFADEQGDLLIRALHIAESSVKQGAYVLGEVEAERRLASNPTRTLVYQALAGVGYGQPIGAASQPAQPLPFVFVHPVLHRLVAFDRRDGSFSQFPQRSHAVAHSSLGGETGNTSGYFVTVPDGLFYTTMSEIDARRGDTLRAARILDDAYIPRASRNPERPLIVFGPTEGDRFELGILSVTIPPAPQR
jgi:hypothetical protein